MIRLKKFLFISCCLCSLLSASAQKNNKVPLPPALTLIKEEVLKSDLFALAGDDMRGKRAGTINELRAAAWLAEQARKAGLLPAGDDSTYFQFFPLRRTRISDNSTLAINSQPVALWQQAWITSPAKTNVSGQITWLQSMADTATNIKGKIIAMPLQAPSTLPAPGMSLWGMRYIWAAVRQQGSALQRNGAAAVLLVADSVATASLANVSHGYEEGQYQLDKGPVTTTMNQVPVILVTKKWTAQLMQPNASFKADIEAESFIYPSVNVVAKAPGTDAALKNEYVLFSGHHDHDGVGIPINNDSIWNGADDNASVSVALLAIGRAWVQKPGNRSALFVWHGAEERGLLGSYWFVDHPTVKKENIVAVLNGDMIGRNHPDSAALLGAILPHRNSVALVDAAMQANKQLTQFKLDTTWDKASHPERWYFRSDHLPYARAGVPAIFFTTLLHADYHTPKDEPQRINITKLARMTKWMYATGWAISNTLKRPAVEATSLN